MNDFWFCSIVFSNSGWHSVNTSSGTRIICRNKFKMIIILKPTSNAPYYSISNFFTKPTFSHTFSCVTPRETILCNTSNHTSNTISSFSSLSSSCNLSSFSEKAYTSSSYRSTYQFSSTYSISNNIRRRSPTSIIHHILMLRIHIVSIICYFNILHLDFFKTSMLRRCGSEHSINEFFIKNYASFSIGSFLKSLNTLINSAKIHRSIISGIIISANDITSLRNCTSSRSRKFSINV